MAVVMAVVWSLGGAVAVGLGAEQRGAVMGGWLAVASVPLPSSGARSEHWGEVLFLSGPTKACTLKV